MPVTRLKSFLDTNHVRYSTLIHSTTYTSSETAQSVHIPGRDLAKTIIFKKDGKLSMAVLPANKKIDLSQLKNSSGAKIVELAGEHEFKDIFPGCEVGAMPPFGNLYQMEVYVDTLLEKEEQIAFNAGSHTELIKLSFKDFKKLVKPKITQFAV